jgi:6-phosphogluconate dehydrogenase
MAADIGLIGLAVMGRNLVLNMARNGYEVAVYNRTTRRMTEFVDGVASTASVTGYEELSGMVAELSSPRIVMLMVQAGDAVDAVIDDLLGLLDEGDIVIDGGNADYVDTERRCDELAEHGILFVGAGVSGGEEGALNGPSIMPGGAPDAWPHVKPILQAIAAVADDGAPCCEWVGRGGAGHFVKMVHNGIEYGDMQVIAEAYSIMQARGMSNAQMAEAFADWNSGKLESFLIEITSTILATESPDGDAVVDSILDSAGQKGTGRWTAMYGFELGQPVSMIAEAVVARVLSALIDERQQAATILAGPDRALGADDVSLDDLRDAVYASKVVSYAQGFAMLAAASAEHDWDLDLAQTAAIWRAGCIIRAAFLDDIMSVFADVPEIPSLLLADTFAKAVGDAQAGWRRTVGAGVANGIPLPAFSSALAFYDGYRSQRLPANLIQAQRDYFGAHTYERIDRPRGEHFHTDWLRDANEAPVD